MNQPFRPLPQEQSAADDGADGRAGAEPTGRMAILSIVALFALMLVSFMVMGLLGLIGGLVHPVVGVLLVMPAYFAMLLLIYVVMFGVMYHMWRDICAGPAEPPALPGDRVEL